MRYLGSFEENQSGQLLIVLELAGAGDLAKFLFRFVWDIFSLFSLLHYMENLCIGLLLNDVISFYGIRFVCETSFKLERGHRWASALWGSFFFLYLSFVLSNHSFYFLTLFPPGRNFQSAAVNVTRDLWQSKRFGGSSFKLHRHWNTSTRGELYTAVKLKLIAVLW